MAYIQICIIGVTMLLVLLISNHSDNSQDWKHLRNVMIATILDMIAECLCWVYDGKVFTDSVQILYVLNSVTIFLQSLISLLWMVYAYQLLGVRIENKINRFLILLPFLFNVIDLALNPWTHYRFFLDSTNHYVLGTLADVDIAVTFIYPLAASIYALQRARKLKTRSERYNCYIIACFVLLPIIGLFFQSALKDSYLLLTFFAIGLLSTYVNIQNRHITTDYLTQINNRNSLMTCFERIKERTKSLDSLSLLIIDIDNFKRINDTCGHVIGDKALIKTAMILKNSCANTHSFLARIGGDEFCILYEDASEEQISEMIAGIHERFNVYNQTHELALPLTVSIGYSSVEQVGTFDSLLAAADRMMYEEKQSKKALRHSS